MKVIPMTFVENIKAPSHPDVPRPSNAELVDLAMQVCYAIERCGASPELTHAVTLASDLHTYLKKPYRASPLHGAHGVVEIPE